MVFPLTEDKFPGKFHNNFIQISQGRHLAWGAGGCAPHLVVSSNPPLEKSSTTLKTASPYIFCFLNSETSIMYKTCPGYTASKFTVLWHGEHADSAISNNGNVRIVELQTAEESGQ
jgi:hypothetical protein